MGLGPGEGVIKFIARIYSWPFALGNFSGLETGSLPWSAPLCPSEIGRERNFHFLVFLQKWLERKSPLRLHLHQPHFLISLNCEELTK